MMTDTILMDPQKAFETINHNILILKKMSVIGCSNYVIDWFKLYLLKWLFRITSENFLNPGPWNILYVVPEGSVLGPLPSTVFLIFEWHAPSCKVKSVFICDSCLVFQGKNVKEFEAQWNGDIGEM